jgi:DNA-binding response OmpR family regulator
MREKRTCILLVDDDPHLLVTLGDFLTSEGFTVIRAESGEEALRRLGDVEPDLIVLDINMPGMGGIAFLKQITSASGKPRYPVLVLTARSTLKDFFKTVAVDGFAPKPCDQAELLGKIRHILAHRPAPAAAPSRPAKVGHATVLLGEDDPNLSELLTARFKRSGFGVEVAVSGPEALEKAAVGQPDVIVLKRILAQMNGDIVASVLHQMSRSRAIPVILYDATGTMPKTDEAALRAAPNVKKRLSTDSPENLLRAIGEVLNRPSAD